MVSKQKSPPFEVRIIQALSHSLQLHGDRVRERVIFLLLLPFVGDAAREILALLLLYYIYYRLLADAVSVLHRECGITGVPVIGDCRCPFSSGNGNETDEAVDENIFFTVEIYVDGGFILFGSDIFHNSKFWLDNEGSTDYRTACFGLHGVVISHTATSPAITALIHFPCESA